MKSLLAVCMRDGILQSAFQDALRTIAHISIRNIEVRTCLTDDIVAQIRQ